MREVTENELFQENQIYYEPIDNANGGITPEMINRVYNMIFPGQTYKIQKPVVPSDSTVRYVECHARVVDKYPNLVAFEDLERPGKIFTIPYKDLVGRIH